MEYIPDNWIIVEIESNKSIGGFIYKILAGWSGGYLYGDSWRMNSGIERWSEDDEYYYFYGYSGSVYKCYKDSEQVRMNISGRLKQLLDFSKENSIMINEISMKDFKERFDNGNEEDNSL